MVLPFAECGGVLESPFLQPVEVPLSVSSPTWSVIHSSQFSILCEQDGRPPSPTMQVINKDVMQHWLHRQLMVAGLQLDFVPLTKALSAPKLSQHSVHLTGHFSSLYFVSLSMRMSWEVVL